jgi:hypothetical protein
MRPWVKNVVMGLGIPAALSLSGFIGYAILSHAGDDSKEKRLSDVEQVAVKLGKIHEADEAKKQQTIDHCNGGIITHCPTCRAVGVVTPTCEKK